MTTTGRETRIVADENVPTIEIIREFGAEPAQVFRAHTDPDLYAQWVGPHSVRTDITRWDPCTGGAWAFANEIDGVEIASFYGSFHEVRPPDRIVWTFTYTGEPDGVALETVTLEKVGERRTRLRVLSVVADFATRDAMLASGMETGVREGYEKLDHLLAPESAPPAVAGPAARHFEDAARFTALVESASVTDWGRPSPVPEWTALDIVRHLVEWSRGFLGGAGLELPALDVAADPAAAWKKHVGDIQALLDRPAGRVLNNPHTGEQPVDQAIDTFYTPDIWMHTWDLAKALDRDPGLDEQRCRAALEGMAPMDRMLRESGQYGPAVPVAANASAQDKLMAFIGRDPAWQPTS